MPDGVTFDDNGAFLQIAGGFAVMGARAGAGGYALVRTYGIQGQAKVKGYASGRPGPNIQTSDYNRSIGLTMSVRGGTTTGTIATNKPQGRRLEYGFDGEDSLGRTYHQPPYKHFGPARDDIEPLFVAGAARLGVELVEDAVQKGTK